MPRPNRQKFLFLITAKKKYILEEGIPVPFLIDLGVMTQNGSIVNAHYDKFRQINRFLEYIEDILPSLLQTVSFAFLTLAAEKSYLTFAIYYYLKVLKGISCAHYRS